jgi:hypothetical protein
MKKIMAGMWVENDRVGQRTLVVRLPAETGGAAYVIEYVCQPFKGKGAQPIHYHLFYTEHFEILAGSCCSPRLRRSPPCRSWPSTSAASRSSPWWRTC